ncbi:hypothetical protein [Pseudomonas silesiensis]|jgi:hypothetical protein|uniref:Uncharacterized protein n=1 Tax=Pseudomonas silesiensis TaxID=1853130 RepID=A0A191YZ10_9PSED|nr:hypothetical protein [Pseudomonas silesiensis]ANJ58135.1 hypothetical protein PMA3_24400 [Pseudomonas silesiensis]VVO86517.1 hypothetical protein PS874_01950 [Pseudomonas fluorescens]
MLNTLQNTPLWVYAIFLLLCYFGTRALYPTRESKTSLLITPPILLGWSLYSLGLTINPLLSISCWMAAVMFGSIVALVIFSREGVELDNTGTGLILPGTLNTLVLYLMFFAVSYYFGYAAEVDPDHAATLPMVLLKACASGLACGLFCGRSARFYQIFLSLKTAPLAGASSGRRSDEGRQR